jgi:hypothetical protein
MRDGLVKLAPLPWTVLKIKANASRHKAAEPRPHAKRPAALKAQIAAKPGAANTDFSVRS